MEDTKLRGAGILGVAVVVFGWFLSGIVAAGTGRSRSSRR